VQQSKALHHSARGVTTDLGSIPGCITTGRDRESHRVARTIGPASEGLARGTLLGSSSSNDSLWRSGRLQADLSSQVNSVSSDTLVRLASEISGRVLRSVVWRVMFRGMHDLTFIFRAHWGVAAMRQDRNLGDLSQLHIVHAKSA
jgi:hypothetical protein